MRLPRWLYKPGWPEDTNGPAWMMGNMSSRQRKRHERAREELMASIRWHVKTTPLRRWDNSPEARAQREREHDERVAARAACGHPPEKQLTTVYVVRTWPWSKRRVVGGHVMCVPCEWVL